MKPKRVVAISDMHAGHRAGLTPPLWQLRPALDDDETSDVARRRIEKWVDLQGECWQWFAREIKALQPIDLLIVNGDCIDGTGHHSGGTELITADRVQQTSMACYIIGFCKAKRIEMVRGTGYHTGQEEDWEDGIAEQVGATIGDHQWPEVNGVTFDVKHFIGASGIPHGRATALLRDDLWNALWHENGEQPRADILLRAHVHYHIYTGGIRNGKPYLLMTMPALQAMGTKFGARKCSGRMDFGFVHFDIDSKGNYQWQPHVADIRAQKAQSSKL
jgi:hypothetical protein